LPNLSIQVANHELGRIEADQQDNHREAVCPKLP